MGITKSQDLKLKIGNFTLAAIFALVPTAMTIAFLTVHGMILCRTLEDNVEKLELNLNNREIKDMCKKSNFDTNYYYVIWVWLFTMIPTWRWFYIGHYRREIELKKED